MQDDLAQGAYYITSNGEAAIIDRDSTYLDRLERWCKTKYILKLIFMLILFPAVDLSRETVRSNCLWSKCDL
jgi:hypothetical protein